MEASEMGFTGRIVVLVLVALVGCTASRSQVPREPYDVFCFWEDANPSRDTLHLAFGPHLDSCKVVVVMTASPQRDTVFYRLSFLIDSSGAGAVAYVEDTVSMEPQVGASCSFNDLNCDGYLDIRLEEMRGMHNDRIFHNWLLDRRKGIFVRNTTFDKISDNISIDCVNKTITQYSSALYDSTIDIYKIGNAGAELYKETREEHWIEAGRIHWTRYVTTWSNGQSVTVTSTGVE
jgi:hypothetical protein